MESSNARPRDDACDSELMDEMPSLTGLLAFGFKGDCDFNFNNNASSDKLALVGG